MINLEHDTIEQKQLVTDMLQNMCSKKIRNIHRKTPVLESRFSKDAGLRSATLLKSDANTDVFCGYWENCQNSFFFYRTVLLAAYDRSFKLGSKLKYLN